MLDNASSGMMSSNDGATTPCPHDPHIVSRLGSSARRSRGTYASGTPAVAASRSVAPLPQRVSRRSRSITTGGLAQ